MIEAKVMNVLTQFFGQQPYQQTPVTRQSETSRKPTPIRQAMQQHFMGAFQ
jgi:hypothetical protein